MIQARMGSRRLPGKVLRPLAGQPMLAHIVQRVRRAAGVGRVVVATSTVDGDRAIVDFCNASGIDCFAGSEEDVLDRFYQAAQVYEGDPLLRITADCPLVDPNLVARLITMFREGAYDHVGVATGAGALRLAGGRFPDGLDTECFSRAALERAWREAVDPRDREHVTPFIWRNTALFRCGHLTGTTDYSHLRWTVDNEADFGLVSEIYAALHPRDPSFGMQDVLDLLASRPDLAALNRHFIGAEQYEELWRIPPAS